MATKSDLREWIIEALNQLGGSGSVLQVSREVWQRHEHDLRQSGDMFYTWQYDLRWAAQQLRDAGLLKPAEGEKRKGDWSLA